MNIKIKIKKLKLQICQEEIKEKEYRDDKHNEQRTYNWADKLKVYRKVGSDDSEHIQLVCI